MATSEDYAKGLLDTPEKEATASTYDAKERTVNKAQDTVQGQLSDVLNENNDYIKRAKLAGQQYAQSRGLLNTSIAAGATHGAAIDAAMPIAQQDADTYFRQGLENQAAVNTSRSTNAQLETNASIANAQNRTSQRNQAMQTMGQIDTQRMSDEGAMARTEVTEAGATQRQTASDIAAMERTNVTEAGATQRTNISEAGATQRANISEAGATQRANISEAAATRRQIASDNAAMARTEFSELEASKRQELIAKTDIETNDARVAAEKLMNNEKVAQADREAFANSFNEINRQHYVEIANYAKDSDLNTDEKNKLITAQNVRLNNDISTLGALYEVPIELIPTDQDTVSSDTTSDTTGGLIDTSTSAVFEEPAPVEAPTSWLKSKDYIVEH